ncbi:MAG: TIM44-like domain-containing protein [Clostridia bacterium]|nr:TIM44-like domain-containing protein [Clostridia bacterium]
MEEKNKKGRFLFSKLLVILVLSVSLLFASNTMRRNVVFADSGFDTSYDSGSSSSDWGSSSSYDYDYSSGSYSGGGGGSIFSGIFGFIIFIIIMIIVSSSQKGGSSTPVVQNVNDEAINNKIKEFIPNFNKAEFLGEGFKIYKDVQNAWMNFKLDDVKEVITDEMFNMYQSQLDTLEVKGEQNIMKDFKQVQAYLKDVVKQNDNITITAGYVIEFYDYIVEQSTGKVLRGSASSKMRVTYEMKFRKTLNDKLALDHCPSCGAKIENMNGSGTCEYCGSKLVSENTKWVLTDKKTINQTRA